MMKTPSTAGRHFVSAVVTDAITDWKRLLAKHSESSSPHFVYGSDGRTFAAYAQSGSTLWVVQLRRAEHPVLVARLGITSSHPKGQAVLVEDDGLRSLIERFHTIRRWDHKHGFKTVAHGSRDKSRFFPFNDAKDAAIATFFEHRTALTRKSRARGPAGKRPRKWQSSFGSRFQGPVLLEKLLPEENPWIRLERNMRGRQIFVSYRHVDYGHAEALVLALRRNGLPVWFDRLALPVAEATQKLDADTATLSWVLDQGLETCDFVVAVATQRYAKPSKVGKDIKIRGVKIESLTFNEWERAKRRIIYLPEGENLPMEKWNDPRRFPHRILKACEPSGAAKEIATLITEGERKRGTF
jgi:hypothetical protein